MSRTAPRCDLRFPTPGVLLDASALVRLWKCDALEALAGTVQLHVAGHVEKELGRQGPAERAAFGKLRAVPHPLRVGTRAWELFGQLWGGRHTTRDLGEYESFAVALAMAENAELLPFVTYDLPAASQARQLDLVTLDFLDTLAWLVGCGALTVERANAIEALASVVDGWKRHPGYSGSIETEREARQAAVVGRVNAWRARLAL
jgi:hypothetical protein